MHTNIYITLRCKNIHTHNKIKSKWTSNFKKKINGKDYDSSLKRNDQLKALPTNKIHKLS